MIKKNIICIGKGNEGKFEKLRDDFAARQYGRDKREFMQEYRIFEFETFGEDADDLKQWLADNTWATDNPNFNMATKLFMGVASGYDLIELPKKTENNRNTVIIYLAAERETDKSIKKKT